MQRLATCKVVEKRGFTAVTMGRAVSVVLEEEGGGTYLFATLGEERRQVEGTRATVWTDLTARGPQTARPAREKRKRALLSRASFVGQQSELGRRSLATERSPARLLCSLATTWSKGSSSLPSACQLDSMIGCSAPNPTLSRIGESGVSQGLH